MPESIFGGSFWSSGRVRSSSSYGASYLSSYGHNEPPKPKPQVKVKPPKPRPVAQWFIEHGKSNPWDMLFTNPTTGQTKKISRRDYENALRVTLPSHGRVILVDDVLRTADARKAAMEKIGSGAKSRTKGRHRVAQAYWRNGHMVKSR